MTARKDKADRYESIAQAIALLRLIRERALTRAEIGDSLGVHERTARRIIEALQKAGLTIADRRRGHAGGPLEYSTRVKI